MSTRRLQTAAKHTMDRVLAAAGLIALSPLLAVMAVLVKLEDGGSILFRQTRAGEAAEPFAMLKFRTMIENADDFLDANGAPTKPRVTRVGRYLRRWSLDELPNLVNVVKGEMTLVGPRPVPLEYARRMSGRQLTRFDMRPGITGLAQVSGRHKLTWSQRVELDATYVETFSLLLDLKIVLRTFRTIVDPETLTERGDHRKVDLG